MFALSFYNYYQLKSLSLKVMNSPAKKKNEKEGKINKKHLIFNCESQKFKLHSLVGLVLSKINTTRIGELRNFMR